MANEVTIVVKSNDATDFSAIGEKARTAMRASLQEGLDETEKTTREKFNEIGDRSGQTLGAKLDEHLDHWSANLGDHVSGPLNREFDRVTEDIDIKVRAKFKETGERSGNAFTRAAKSGFDKLAGMGGDAGIAAGSQVNQGLLSGLNTDVAGFSIFKIALVAALIASAPAIGALAAAGIVLAFGAGLAALGLVASFHFKSVQKEASKFGKFFSGFMKDIGKPFTSTWKAIFDTATHVLKVFQPILKGVFKDFVAPAVTDFVKNLGNAFEQLAPSLPPIAKAFSDLLGAIGPQLPGIFKELSDAFIEIAHTISDNPQMFANMITGLIELFLLAVKLIPVLAVFFGKLVAITSKAWNFSVEAKDKVSGVIDKVMGVVKGFVRGVYKVAITAKETVTAVVHIAQLVAKRFARGAYKALLTAHETVTAVAHIAELVARRFARAAYRAVLSAKSAVGGAVSSATSACRGFARRVYRASLTAVNRVAAALRAAFDLGNQWAGKVFTATFDVVKKIWPFAHGGIVGGQATGGPVRGLAAGGPGSALTLVGEQGAELVRLPTGSTVIPHGQSMNMLNQAGGGQTQVTLEVIGGDSDLQQLLVKILRNFVRVTYGKGPDSVQKALSGA